MNMKPRKPRCFICRKKLGAVESVRYACKCERALCAAHAQPWLHDCPISFTEERRRRLQESLPRVQASKIAKL